MIWECTRRFWPRLKEGLWPDGIPTPPPDPRCTECTAKAEVQVTELTRADLHLDLPGAQPRCRRHGQILLRRL